MCAATWEETMGKTTPPSSRNKTDSWLRMTGIVLATLGAADALYLWVLKR